MTCVSTSCSRYRSRHTRRRDSAGNAVAGFQFMKKYGILPPTPEGTFLVADLNHTVQGFGSSTPSYFAALDDGRVVFTADDGVNGAEPWTPDGTAAAPQPLGKLFPGAAGSGATGYLALGTPEATPA